MRCDVMLCLRDFCSPFLLERPGSYLAQVWYSCVPVAELLYWYLHAWREALGDLPGNRILITPRKLVAYRLDQHVACILITYCHVWL